MAYSNYLLFNNIFLKNLKPTEDELAAARYLVHESARDWYSEENFESPQRIAENWVQPMLNQQTLDLIPSDLDENAWFVVAPWDRETPLALCYVVPAGENLDGCTEDGQLPKGQHWMIHAVNLARQQAELNLRWVILTNGVQWRLLDASALRRYEAYLEIDLYSLLNGENDPLAAYLFYRLFRLEDGFARDEATGQNALNAFLKKSVEATEATEAYLKTTVSDNLATPGGGDGIMAQLCMGFVNAVDPEGSKSFSEDERAAIYRDATYLLYRLLFILYAEARGLLPMDRPDYQSVSLSRIVDEAVELCQHPSQSSLTPSSLWEQLSTLFNAIHFSDEYLGIPPYNGGLFEDKDKPYLKDYQINNTYLAEALYELSFLLEEKGTETPERIDCRDLSVRHLGSLYEGMIEYKLFIAEEELLARRDKNGKVKYLPAAKTSQKPNDEVIQPGKVYFAQSPHERKSTGTHYTAEELVAKLVQQTVGRLLDARWAEYQPQFQQMWQDVEDTPDEDTRLRLQLRLDSELETFVQEQVLSLRICDPAMGSGHFLVHIAHTLTNFILESLTLTHWENPDINLDPDYWRRLVVEQCLYGVDINNMAVELAKLSLWLATMQFGHPLSFLDHRLKQGNSLLGVSLEEILTVLADDALNQVTARTRIAEERGQYGFRTIPKVMQTLYRANQKLAQISEKVVERVEDVDAQEISYEEVQEALKPYKEIGDLLVARKMGWKVKDHELRNIVTAVESSGLEMLSDAQQKSINQGVKLIGEQLPFHWELEFSEVFFSDKEDVGGFDIVSGNPPFLGGKKISTQLGRKFLTFLKDNYSPTKGAADLCSYFFRLSFSLLSYHGFLGMVATNTIAQGDTRETGLSILLKQGGVVNYAERFVTWGGDANVEVNLVSLTRLDRDNKEFLDKLTLDGVDVSFISSWLDDWQEIQPKRLEQNKSKAFNGDFLHSNGFLLDTQEAINLMNMNADNKECLFPYLSGIDINNDLNQQSDRYAICFHDWSYEKSSQHSELMKIVRENVKPERDKVNRISHKKNWWLYGDYRKGLRHSTKNLSRVLARSMVSERHILALVPNNQVFSIACVIFAYDDYYHFALLQSGVHEIWLRRQASTMRTDVRYTPTDCFQTFPFPQQPVQRAMTLAENIGETYYKHRQQVTIDTQLGLTKTYNRFHDPGCWDDDIQTMRQLHAEMDQAVLACYGWGDIDLQHDFYPNDRGKIRYMPARDAQREIFTRLIALNQQIAAEEAAQGAVAEDDGEEDEFDDEE
ncbi:MAG: hypothetical protein ISR58_11945 [Anaerolineales bacterium]|nr:hypothetical protein [Anaerolineales bacterium]